MISRLFPAPAISKFLAVFLLLLGMAGPLFADERSSVKLLTIGNSFAGNATEFLPELSMAGGKKLQIFRVALPGCSMERHAKLLQAAQDGKPEGNAYTGINPRTGEKGKFNLADALGAQPWEFVTIQQASKLSFLPETFQPYADELVAAVRKLAPHAEIMIHETWAYRKDHPIFQKNDGFTPEKMYEGLKDAYRKLAGKYGFRLIPVGDAFQAARQTERWTYVKDPNFNFANPPADTLPRQDGDLIGGWRWLRNKETGKLQFNLDAMHANVAGRYLGASVWYLILFNADTVPATFTPKGLSPDDAAKLREIAQATVRAERQHD